MSRDDIKKLLIEACEKGDANIFKPALLHKQLKTGFKDNKDFYNFLKERIDSAHCDVNENLYLKIRNHEDESIVSYEFFSKSHVYSRLSIQINEFDECVVIDLIPF